MLRLAPLLLILLALAAACRTTPLVAPAPLPPPPAPEVTAKTVPARAGTPLRLAAEFTRPPVDPEGRPLVVLLHWQGEAAAALVTPGAPWPAVALPVDLPLSAEPTRARLVVTPWTEPLAAAVATTLLADRTTTPALVAAADPLAAAIARQLDAPSPAALLDWSILLSPEDDAPAGKSLRATVTRHEAPAGPLVVLHVEAILPPEPPAPAPTPPPPTPTPTPTPPPTPTPAAPRLSLSDIDTGPSATIAAPTPSPAN